MENNLKEREINLWDMFWAVCQQWRWICLGALLTAVFVGGMSYIRSERAIRALEEPQQNIQIEELGEEDQIYVRIYLDYYESYYNQLRYNHGSPLMKLDANGLYLCTLEYYIDNYYQVEYPVINKNNNLDGIIRAYQSSLKEEEIGKKLQQELAIQDESLASYVMEQIDFDNQFGSQEENGDGVMTIFIYGDSTDTCKKIAEVVKVAIEQRKPEIVQQVGEHSIVLTEEAYSFVTDNDLLTYQKDNVDRLYSYSSNLANVKKLLSSDAQNCVVKLVEKKLLDEETKLIDTQDDKVKQPKATVSKKMILVGFVAGAIMVMGIATFLYMINNRLLYEDNFEELYGIKVFGHVEAKRPRKLFGIIDNTLLKLRRINQHHFENSEVVEMIYMGIKLTAQKRGIKSIYITGAGLTKNNQPILDQIINRLNEDGIDIQIGKSILYYADALEQLTKFGNVVLLEKAGVSFYQEILKEIEICLQQEVYILGTIIME